MEIQPEINAFGEAALVTHNKKFEELGKVNSDFKKGIERLLDYY